MSDTYFSATYHKARKEHRCELCKRVIERGEQYRRQSGVYDGRMYRVICCLQCEAFATLLQAIGFENDEGGWPWIAELDRGEVAECGYGHEYDLFKQKWLDSDGLLVIPLSADGRRGATT